MITRSGLMGMGLVAGLWVNPARACVHSRGPADSPPKMSQTAQQALLIHKGGYETLALGLDYRADAALSGLAWVVPVPNIPDMVGTAPSSLFSDLESWVQPRWIPAPAQGRSSTGSRSQSTDITIHAARTAGPYTIHPLEASGSDAADELNAWMVASGFEAISDALLGYYADRSWTFLVIELETSGGLRRSGAIEPLVLGFESRTAVLPLKLTTRMGRFPVRLYLVTDDPLEESALAGARERGFMVAGSEDWDYLPSVVPGAGSLQVEVETFAHGDAPQSVQSVLDQAGEWTLQESLELRMLTNPDFGEGVGMSLFWEEDLSVPAIPPFSLESTVEPEVVVVQPGTGPAPEPEEEQGGFFGCQTAGVQPGVLGGLFAWLLSGLRRRSTWH